MLYTYLHIYIYVYTIFFLEMCISVTEWGMHDDDDNGKQG